MMRWETETEGTEGEPTPEEPTTEGNGEGEEGGEE